MYFIIRIYLIVDEEWPSQVTVFKYLNFQQSKWLKGK